MTIETSARKRTSAAKRASRLFLAIDETFYSVRCVGCDPWVGRKAYQMPKGSGMPLPVPVILSACRTPIGRYLGGLAGRSAIELGVVAARAALDRAEIDPAAVDEAIVGCVLPAGLGQAPARQVALGAGV